MSRPASQSPLSLRERGEELAVGLPALMAEAHRLSASVMAGAHGRRRAGPGDDFWQYRPAEPHDEARRIDWRRSARSDQLFLREREWQAPTAVHLWVDRGASMNFASDAQGPTKGWRARVLALATAILLERGGERVGLADGLLPPRSGPAQIERLATALVRTDDAEERQPLPDAGAMLPGARAVFVSDFLSEPADIARAVRAAAGRGVAGLLVQVLDPAEEEFPFAGRTIFESMTGTMRHETREARGLQQRYLDRLGARRDQLAALARDSGWDLTLHRTDAPALPVLLGIGAALGGWR